ncbi:MAG TPA: DPP IV N-terminal domain-containing protein [Gemmataceae bacterium]
MLPAVPVLFSLVFAPNPGAKGADPESPYLRNVKQVTFDFVRAGEGYFSPDGKRIIFQAEEKDTGNPFYQIFIMDLESGRHWRVSPGVGRTTCAYFHPGGEKVIFASSHLDPKAKEAHEAEYKKREEDRAKGIRRRYDWVFDPYLDIFEANPDGTGLKNLTRSKGYDAEGAYSADGKRIVFCSDRDGNPEIYVMNADGSGVRQLTKTSDCYNGGPFFSPDGSKVIFRADRKEKDRLQLYVINADGTGERALTDNPNWVYWAPYWYRDGKHIIYTAADHSVPGRPNYDLYWMNTETGKTTRITHDPAADVLPVFSPDGKKLMWTSTRTDDRSSQLFLADFTPPEE